MLMIYSILLIVFSIYEYKLCTKLNKTNFLNGKVNSFRVAAFFFFVNTYLVIHILMMYQFSSFIFTRSSKVYTLFFHSSLTIEDMQEMDTKFIIIMVLIHFNPTNLILNYVIIKFEDFTSILSTVNKELN